MHLDFHIPCTVMPKQSVRGGSIRYYQTDRITTNAKVLASYMLPHRPETPLTGALRVWYFVRYPYRKSEPKKNRNRPIAKDTPPDVEQLAKQLSDVLESCDFFKDDAYIADGRVVKMWDETPGVRVMIEPIEAMDLVFLEGEW